MMPHEMIKQYLKTHGIKQSWLAEKSGISNPTLSQILSGKTGLSADLLYKIWVLLACQAIHLNRQRIMPRIVRRRNQANTTLIQEISFIREVPHDRI